MTLRRLAGCASCALALAPLAQDSSLEGPVDLTAVADFNPTGPMDDRGQAVVVDDAHAWIAGESLLGPPGQGRAPLRKYALGDGALVWSAALDEADWSESVEALDLSSDGAALYAAGVSDDGLGALEVFVARVDALTGAEVWSRRWLPPNSTGARAVDIAIAPDGQRVYVTGDAGSFFQSSLFVAGFSASDGTELWFDVDKPNTDPNHSANGNGVEVSADSERVYVGGGWHLAGDALHQDMHARAYTKTGGGLWELTIASGAQINFEGAEHVALDAAGSTLYLGGRNSPGDDVFAIDTGLGQGVWSTDMGVHLGGLVPSADGTALFALAAENATLDSARLVRLAASDGAQVWESLWSQGPGTIEFPRALAIGPQDATLYGLIETAPPGVSAEEWVVTWSAATGQELFALDTQGNADVRFGGLDVSPSGAHAVVVGHEHPLDSDDHLWTAGVDVAGGLGLAWTQIGDELELSPTDIRDVVHAPDGSRSYGVGYRGYGLDQRAVMVAFEGDGSGIAWHSVDAGGTMADHRGAALSPDGTVVYGTGRRGTEVYVAARSSADGALLWETDWVAPNGHGWGMELAPSPDGARLLVAGASVQANGFWDVVTLCLDAQTGGVLWDTEHGLEFAFDEPAAVVVDEVRVYVSTRLDVLGPNTDALTQARSLITGELLWEDLFDGSGPGLNTGGDEPHALALAPDGARLYVAINLKATPQQVASMAVRSLDPQFGNPLWMAGTNASPAAELEPRELLVSADGSRLYLGVQERFGGTFREHVIALAASGGAVLWETDSGPLENVSIGGLALTSDEREITLFASAEFAPIGAVVPTLHLTHFDTADGALLWEVWNGLEGADDAAAGVRWNPAGDQLLAVGRVSAGNVFTARSLVLEPHTLIASTTALSLAAGGQQELSLRAGADQAGDFYLVLGSTSGTTPPTPAGGGFELPLNFDVYTSTFLIDASTTPVSGAFGVLDATGRATAAVVLAPGSDPALQGLSVHHAYVALSPANVATTLASNAVQLDLLP